MLEEIRSEIRKSLEARIQQVTLEITAEHPELSRDCVTEMICEMLRSDDEVYFRVLKHLLTSEEFQVLCAHHLRTIVTCLEMYVFLGASESRALSFATERLLLLAKTMGGDELMNAVSSIEQRYEDELDAIYDFVDRGTFWSIQHEWSVQHERGAIFDGERGAIFDRAVAVANQAKTGAEGTLHEVLSTESERQRSETASWLCW